MVSAQSEKYWPDSLPSTARPIEFLTENEFSVVRREEVDGVPLPYARPYHFLVSTPQGLEREVVVDVADSLIAEVHVRTGGRVSARSSFWICCAERHLANYISEHDECPPDNKLRIDECDAEALMLAMRWTST